MLVLALCLVLLVVHAEQSARRVRVGVSVNNF